MIDAREQIASALETVCSNVKMSRPDGDVELPLVCYACMENLDVNAAYAHLRWRIACYCNSFEDVVDMVHQIEAVMNGELGYTKTYETPDDNTKLGTDFYLKRLDFSALVNKERYTVIRGTM